MNLLNGLTEQEKSYYLLLNSMRKQEPNEKEFSFVRTIVQFSSSPVLLSMVISCDKWYHTVEIKEALSQNDVVPAGFNAYLRNVLHIVDLFREMGAQEEGDRKSIMVQAKDEISKLKEPDRLFLKQLISGTIQHDACTLPDTEFEKRIENLHREIFLVEEEHSFTALTSEEKVVKAKTSTDSLELRALLQEADRNVWETALKNRYLQESELLNVLSGTDNTELLREVYGFPRWFFRDRVREALVDNPKIEEHVAAAIETSWTIVELFEKLSKLKHNVSERNATAIEIAEQLKQVPELELQYITVVVKRQWPGLLNIIKAFYHFTQKKTATGQPAVDELDQIERLSNSSIDQLITISASSDNEKELHVMLQHPDLNVFRNLLTNRNVNEQLLGGYVHMLTRDQLTILNRSSWKDHHGIRNRMIHNPNLPEETALAILDGLTDMKDLLDVLRDPKIKSVEVKNRTFKKLSELFSHLSVKEKAEIIVLTNGEIFRELWGEIFRDDELLQTLVEHFEPSPEILVRIIHSRLTSLSVIHMIINRGLHLDNAGVVLEFYSNPKVTSDVLVKLQSRLSDTMVELLKERDLFCNE